MRGQLGGGGMEKQKLHGGRAGEWAGGHLWSGGSVAWQAPEAIHKMTMAVQRPRSKQGRPGCRSGC